MSRLHTDKGRVTYRGATHTTPQTLDGPTEIDEITRQVWLSLTMFNMCTLSVAAPCIFGTGLSACAPR